MDLKIKDFINNVLKGTAIELIVKLLVGLILLGGSFVWALIDLQSLIDFFNLKMPLWEVLIIFVLLIVAYWIYKLRLKNSWKNYKSDIYSGIKFSWEYEEKGRIKSLKVFCPKCGIKMNGVIKEEKISWGHTFCDYYRCPICNKKTDFGENALVSIIEANIEKKKRRI